MRALTLLVMTSGAWGVKQLLDLAQSRRKHLETREAVTTWEGEGGAVPVATNRIASQVRPAPASEVAGERPLVH